MVRSIEETHSAALELPSSLQEVQEAKRVIAQAQAEINVHIAKAQDAVGGAGDLLEKLRVSSLQGQEYLESCESAYSASVAKGLASAFLERSKRLSESMWLWVGSLIASLVAGVYWGGQRVDTLASAAHSTTTSASTVALDAVLALISVAAPVWFAWLATRQIGQTFRLSEDYAYKASVARSYEGYRKEAKSVNDVLVEQLLASAIRRVDEQPLRVVQQTSANSPWHDLLSSPVVGRAFDVVPDFAAQVKNLAREAMKKSDSGSNDKASQ
ncbi:MAG: hypothetical protein CFE44_16530 [Burkholderiales bacterium PBB4]|nr:MAG: hypothetical protein CFE44_16530 [Burkholderiales bacterium PBB4]